jgi:hypothetical protein
MVVTKPESHQVTSLRRWSTKFVHNLYSDGRPIVSDDRWVYQPAYQSMRKRIVSRHLEQPVITAIKLIHTAIFVVIMGFILHFTYSGIRNRVNRWSAVTLAIVAGEGIVLGVNGGRCPLTLAVEDLGSEHGSVSDIFLPDWVARHIPHISTVLIGVGLVALITRRAITR